LDPTYEVYKLQVRDYCDLKSLILKPETHSLTSTRISADLFAELAKI